MKNLNNPYVIGLGIVLLVCGTYWIYKGGDLLEILLPIILGLGSIIFGLYRPKNEDVDLP